MGNGHRNGGSPSRLMPIAADCPKSFGTDGKPGSVNWTQLVDSREAVQSDEPLERVHRRFAESGSPFLAVVQDTRALGLCSRDEVGMRLGSEYGFALFHKTPVAACLMADPLVISVGEAWADVLERIFFEGADHFYPDLLLVDDKGDFVGTITVRSLVKLQTRVLKSTIAELEARQAEIARQNAQMTRDLLLAREMQLAMFAPAPYPRELPSSLGYRDIRVSTVYAPLDLVSGDFCEILEVTDSAVAVVIADVMGHGVQAALITAMLRALIQTHRGLASDPGRFLTRLNGGFCEILESSRLEIFATALVLVLDAASSSVVFSSAGHPPPLRLRPGSASAEFLDNSGDGNGGILGVSAGTRFGSERCPALPGDKLLLFTDGIYEIEDAAGGVGSLDRLRAMAAGLLGEPVESVVEKLVNSGRANTPADCFSDDVCVVGVELVDAGRFG